jgi:hypothetical protein
MCSTLAVAVLFKLSLRNVSAAKLTLSPEESGTRQRRALISSPLHKRSSQTPPPGPIVRGCFACGRAILAARARSRDSSSAGASPEKKPQPRHG